MTTDYEKVKHLVKVQGLSCLGYGDAEAIKGLVDDHEAMLKSYAELARSLPTDPPKKPNIEEVFAVFHEFQVNSNRMTQAIDPMGWPTRMRELRQRLKARLDDLGIGQQIDWADPNG